MRTSPLVFELSRGEVAQRGVDALVHIDLVKKPTHLTGDIIIVLIVR